MKRWLIAPLIITAIALLAVACGDDDDQAAAGVAAELDALWAEIDHIKAVAEQALVRASLPAVDALKFHAMEERIVGDGRVDPADPGFLQRALRALASGGWPAALRPNVEAFRAAVEAAVGPVLDNDPEAAARPVRVAHRHAHEFETAVAAYFDGRDIPPPPDVDPTDPTPMDHGAGEGSGGGHHEGSGEPMEEPAGEDHHEGDAEGEQSDEDPEGHHD